MRNKFEALNAFQSWPEDWQRLCAEYWTESDKPKDIYQAHVEPDAVAKIAQAVRSQACKVLRKKVKTGSPTASRASRPFTKEEYDCAIQKPSFMNDAKYAEGLAKKFGRTKKAFQNYLSLIRRNLVDPNTGMKLPTVNTNEKEAN